MKRTCHVVLDALQVAPQPAGVSRAILEYIRVMSSEERGLSFTVLASHPEAFDFLAGCGDWAVHHCPGVQGRVGQKVLFTQWGMPRLLSHLGADVLHSMQFITPLRCPCPSVATVHDMVWRLHPETIERSRRAYYRFMVPRCLRATAVILTNSEATARDVRRCLPGVAGKVQVTAFGTPTWLAREGTEFRRPPEVKRTPFFLFVGTLEPRKNLPNLLASFALFLQGLGRQETDESHWPRLLLVGAKGWKMNDLAEILAAFPYPDFLQWRDYVSGPELAGLYADALALVFPSLYEGFGFPVLEAMSVGLPVMTSGRGALAEVSGGAALLIDPLDPGQMARTLHRLYADPDLRRSLSAMGLRQAATWNWQKTVAATLPVYRRLGGAEP